MAYDQLSLSNIALNMAGGRSQISSLAELSNEAKNCALIFSKTVREVLAFVPWDFNTDTRPLTSPIVGYVPPPWKTAWARPADTLTLLSVRDGAGQGSGVPIFPGGIGQSLVPRGSAAFAAGSVGGVRAIFTNTTAPIITRTVYTNNFAVWSEGAIEILTTKLAERLAIPISGDKGLRDRLMQERMGLESRWRAMAANESLDVQDVPTDWMLARDGIEFPFLGYEALASGAVQPDPGLVNVPAYPNLPTTPPDTSGMFWNDGGLLAISP